MADANIDALLQDIVSGSDFDTSLNNYIHNILYPSSEATQPSSQSVDRSSTPQSHGSPGGNFTPDENGYITGRAATFATPSDLANYARNGSLATGDNGRGAFGHNTSTTPGVAIPRDVLEAVYGSTRAAAGRPVEVVLPSGQKHVLPIVDVAPRVQNRANNAVIEFSGGAVKQFGLGDTNGVKYKFL